MMSRATYFASYRCIKKSPKKLAFYRANKQMRIPIDISAIRILLTDCVIHTHPAGIVTETIGDFQHTIEYDGSTNAKWTLSAPSIIARIKGGRICIETIKGPVKSITFDCTATGTEPLSEVFVDHIDVFAKQLFHELSLLY
jgi:hypothetical protein